MAHLVVVRAAEQRRRPRGLPKPRIYRDRTQPLDIFDDAELIRRYRLPRHCIIQLCDELIADLERPTMRSHALSVTSQIFTALQFYATGTFQRVDGDLHGVSQSSVSRIVEAVSTAMSLRAANLIKFPTSAAEQRQIIADFYKLADFPSVLGCIDGTQVPILAPRENEHVYVCRKGYHSLNVQVVCDAKLRFLNIVAKWPGSSHDSFMWRNSNLYNYLESRPPADHGWLLGDSGYPLSEFLLTPVMNPTSAAEQRYNRSHIRTRNTVERSIGLLKTRFRCLHKTGGCLLSPPDRCAKIVTACAMLHNICIANSVPAPEIDVPVDDDADDVYAAVDAGQNARVRNSLIAHRFTNEQ